MCECQRNVMPGIRNSKGEKDAHEEYCSQIHLDIFFRPEVYTQYPKYYHEKTIALVDRYRNSKC
jgi:hypothetical protein